MNVLITNIRYICVMIQDFRLKVFYLTARCGSFSRAARELDISQPAVSQNIAELEQDIGADLFFREPGKSISLTPKGRSLMEYAGRILSLYESLNAELVPGGRCAAEPVVLRIAAVRLAVQFILPEAVKKYSRAYPYVSFSVVEREDGEIPALLEEGDADLGVTYESLGDRSLPLAELRAAGAAHPIVSLFATPAAGAAKEKLSRSFILTCLTQ